MNKNESSIIEKLTQQSWDKDEVIKSLKSAIEQHAKDVVGFTILTHLPEEGCLVDLSGFDAVDCEILCGALGLYVMANQS